MVYLFLGILAIYYVLIVIRLFTVWLAVFRRDTSVSLNESPGSLLIIVFITILWPFVVPFAYLELLKAQQKIDGFWLMDNQITTAEEESTNSK